MFVVHTILPPPISDGAVTHWFRHAFDSGISGSSCSGATHIPLCLVYRRERYHAMDTARAGEGPPRSHKASSQKKKYVKASRARSIMCGADGCDHDATGCDQLSHSALWNIDREDRKIIDFF